MRKQTTIRDTLYQQLDALINYAVASNKKLPSISLSSNQFQIFQDFNKPDSGGSYRYRQLLIKGK